MSVHLLLYIAYIYMYLCIHLYVYVYIYMDMDIYTYLYTFTKSLLSFLTMWLSQIHADFTLSKVLLYIYF